MSRLVSWAQVGETTLSQVPAALSPSLSRENVKSHSPHIRYGLQEEGKLQGPNSPCSPSEAVLSPLSVPWILRQG